IHNATVASGGIRPNRIAMDAAVADYLIDHPSIQDKIKYTFATGGVVSREVQASLLAQVFRVDKVVLADINIQNTAGEQATPSFSRVWSDNVLIYRYEPIRRGTAATGAIFKWTEPTGGLPM